jgi:hypothetical protein
LVENGVLVANAILGGSNATAQQNQIGFQDGFGVKILSLLDGLVRIQTGTTGTIEKTFTFDNNGNITFNNFIAGAVVTTASGGTTVLAVDSARTQILVGSTTHTFELPDATTLSVGQSFIVVNNSSGVLTVTNNASATIEIIPPGGVSQLGATSIATNAGTWGIYSFLPGTYNFNTTSADFGNAVISNATWNGNQIPYNYGGTTLTTFGAANNALYSTSATALTAGTLPAAAGGTGLTSPGTTGNVLTSNGTSWTSAPIVTISADDAYFLSFMMG